MYWKIFLIAVLFLPAGCNRPAEEAGGEMVSWVEQIRLEALGLEKQVSGYKQQIEQARQELESYRMEVAQSIAELLELRQLREEIIIDMERMQQEQQAGGSDGREAEPPPQSPADKANQALNIRSRPLTGPAVPRAT